MTQPMRHSLMCDAEWARHRLYPGPMPEPAEGRPKTAPECWTWHPGSSLSPPGWEWHPEPAPSKVTPCPRRLWVSFLERLK